MKILEPFSNMIVPCLKNVGADKWRFLRGVPYFEGWLQVEVCSYILLNGSQSVSERYFVRGFDIPARTDNPIGRRRTWYPDLLFFTETMSSGQGLETCIWLELKVVSLARNLVERKRTLSRYRHKISKTWRALCGLSVGRTISAWQRHPQDQQLLSMGIKLPTLVSEVEKGEHFIAMLVVATALKEGPDELLSASKELIEERMETRLFEGFDDDWLILFGKHL